MDSMEIRSTSLKSYGEIEVTPRETYGTGKVILRVGNGGAGATGLIEALATDFLSSHQRDGSIAWVCNHSRNTQLALLHNYIDVALTYERDQEESSESEGWSHSAGCAFHDHFVLAGPVSDPAGLASAKSLIEAMKKIANTRVLFHSRADDSATMWKERGIWSTCGLEPWKDGSDLDDWYMTSLRSPSEALTEADASGAYLLTDRSTLLRQTMLGTISNTTVFIEPTNTNDVLMNSCYALNPQKFISAEQELRVTEFLEYLFSDRGQLIVATWGGQALGGFPLFAPVADGFANSYLRKGRPQNGKWEKRNSPF